MADLIKIVPADFQKTTAEFHRIEALLNDYKEELSGKYFMMVNDWQGLAGEAFGDCCQKVLNSFEMNIESLNRLATDIEQACQFMEAFDRGVSEVVSRA